jgi:BMFP domain-containing protein YqiC
MTAYKHEEDVGMAKDHSKNSPETSTTTTATTDADTPIEEALRPFQEAANKFIQAQLAAQEAAMKDCAQAWLDHQDAVRQIEQDAQRQLSEVTRKSLEQLGQQGPSGVEQMFTARMQAQADYENEVRRIYSDAESKLASLHQKLAEESAGGERLLRKATDQRQDAYQTYLSDLQQAWANTKSLDPQTITSIASHILWTMSSVGHAG